jgi:hypothetical protein
VPHAVRAVPLVVEGVRGGDDRRDVRQLAFGDWFRVP